MFDDVPLDLMMLGIGQGLLIGGVAGILGWVFGHAIKLFRHVGQ